MFGVDRGFVVLCGIVLLFAIGIFFGASFIGKPVDDSPLVEEAIAENSETASSAVKTRASRNAIPDARIAADNKEDGMALANEIRPFLNASNVGKSPGIKRDENPAVAAIVASIESNSNPERRTPFITPAPFSREEFLADPDAYLSLVEPGRVYQSLPHSEDVSSIKEVGNQYFRVLQGEGVVLQARVDPLMPVTFYSAKLGQFSNELTSITVRADEEGSVSATFKASGGTRGEIDVIASSPVHSGVARYVVNVLLPDK